VTFLRRLLAVLASVGVGGSIVGRGMLCIARSSRRRERARLATGLNRGSCPPLSVGRFLEAFGGGCLPFVLELIPDGEKLGRRILYDQFLRVRDDLDKRVLHAGTGARAIPIVAGVDVGLIGAYGLLGHPVPLGWIFVVLVVAASILVAGFFSCADLVTVVYDLVALAELEGRLGVPFESGYWLGDLAGHHVGRGEPKLISWWNRNALGIPLRNAWIRNSALLPLWAAAVTAAIGGAALLVFSNLEILAAPTLAGIGVFLALTGIVRLMYASLPTNVLVVLRRPDEWFHSHLTDEQYASLLPPD
jgi:hypothetical protein